MYSFNQNTVSPFAVDNNIENTFQKVAISKRIWQCTDNNFPPSIFDLPQEKLDEMLSQDKKEDK